MDLQSLEQLIDPQAISQGTEAVNQAPQEQIDAHRGLLGEAFQMLEQQGGSSQAVAQQAQSGTIDPQAMDSESLVRTTLAFAHAHPQIVEDVASRYPAAQPIINAVLGSATNNTGSNSGMFGGLLNRITGL